MKIQMIRLMNLSGVIGEMSFGRAGELAGAKEAFEEVEKQYNITVNAIKAM